MFFITQDYSLTTNGIGYITVKTDIETGSTSTASTQIDATGLGKITSMCVFDEGLQRREKSKV